MRYLRADASIERHLHLPPEPLNQRILLVATHYAILYSALGGGLLHSAIHIVDSARLLQWHRGKSRARRAWK